jgi:hypothetical protein
MPQSALLGNERQQLRKPKLVGDQRVPNFQHPQNQNLDVLQLEAAVVR